MMSYYKWQKEGPSHPPPPLPSLSGAGVNTIKLQHRTEFGGGDEDYSISPPHKAFNSLIFIATDSIAPP